MKPIDKNNKLLIGLAVGVGLMIGLSYASVPLYSLFCRATGFAGTPIRVAAEPSMDKNAPEKNRSASKERTVTVSFDGNVDPALPWDFEPETKSVTLKLGEVTTIKYRAHNRADKALVGTASYNVQPDKAGAYFDKIQCFCFTKQVLKPGETVELPVEFFVDKAILEEAKNDDVQNITLSYTFFLAKDQRKAERFKQAHLQSNQATSNP